MNPLTLIVGLGAMFASASGTMVWMNERAIDALDNSHLAGLLDDDGRVALEGRSFRQAADSTGDLPARPSASTAPRGLPSDPNSNPESPLVSLDGGSLDGEHHATGGDGIPAPVQGDGGVYSVDFAHLLFADYDPPELRAPDKPKIELSEFPEVPQSLNEQEIAISGFMIAVDWKDRKIERFLLGRFPPGCCYGQVPLFDEWIEINNEDANCEEYSSFETLTVRGTLQVGEVLDDEGYVLSLYRLKASSVRPLY